MLYTFSKTLFYYQLVNFEYRSFKDLDLYITSHGGVGTSFFIEHLSKFKSTNTPYSTQSDLVKHLPSPPRKTPHGLNIIYIFGDPIDATISLFRRNFAYLQCCKNGSFNTIKRNETIQDYIRCNRDKLGLLNHLERWLKKQSLHNNYLFINYENIWNNLDIIQDFAEIKGDFIHGFPERKPRNSGYFNLSNGEKLALRNIYSDYYKRISQIGEFKMYQNIQRH